MGMCVYASAQSGVDQGKGTSGSPVLREKIRRASVARDEGEALLKQGKLDLAIVAFRRAVAAEEVLRKDHGYFGSSGSYRLAKALTQSGRAEEALVAYRKAFWWSEKRQDLESNGPPFTDLGADYALLLAKAGKYEEAKAMYYWVMRQWIQVGGYEDFPFLVVFEPDPTMVVWENKPEKILSAILMLRALHTQELGSRRERIAEVRSREPAWIVPFVYANQRGNWDTAWIRQAATLAANPDEEAWIAAFDEVLASSSLEQQRVAREVKRRLEKMASERRKNSPVLLRAKQDMAQMHKRLAD
jgi:tetratricopeptide (TPR) repeat protein